MVTKNKLILIITLVSIQVGFAQCFVNSPNNFQNGYRTFSSTGQQNLDNMFYSANNYLAKALNLSTYVGFYDDSQTGQNAFAMPGGSMRVHGQTYFGIGLLNKYIIKSQNTNFYVFWILAHEYAHILQYSKGGPHYNETKWNELQEDFLAGAISSKDIVDRYSNNTQYYYNK